MQGILKPLLWFETLFNQYRASVLYTVSEFSCHYYTTTTELLHSWKLDYNQWSYQQELEESYFSWGLENQTTEWFIDEEEMIGDT